MDDKIIQFPVNRTRKPVEDPETERALFFLDHELAEMTATIPQAEPTAPRAIY